MPVRSKVLLVDSDPDLLIVLEKFLEDAGYDTSTTWDGAEATSWIESQFFAAVVVGEHLRKVRSADLLHKLRDKNQATVCIVLSGPRHRVHKEDELYAMGVRAIVSRWDLKELVETLQATIPKTSVFAA